MEDRTNAQEMRSDMLRSYDDFRMRQSHGSRRYRICPEFSGTGESHLLGAHKSVNLFVDNQKAAQLGSGDFYYTTLPVGSHSLMASEFQLTNAVLTGGDKQSLFFRVKAEEKKNKFVEYNYYNGTFSILPEEDGKKLVLESDRVAEEHN